MKMNNAVHATPIPFYTVLIVYLVAMGLIGLYSSKKTTSLSEFFVMNAKAGTVISGLSYFATQYSMSTFMGVPATIYKVGYAGLAVSVPGLVFSMIIPAIFIGGKLIVLGKKYNFLTMADYLSDRYESPSIRILLAVLMIIFLIPNMGAQTIGAGIIVNIFTGLPVWVGIVGMGLIVIAYCMAGGIRGVMITDAVQGSLMVGTAIVAFILTVKMGGGLSNINQTLANTNPEMLSFPGTGNYMPWQNYLSQIVMWSFFTMGQPQLFTRFFAMKDHKVMFKAVLLGTAGMWLAATLIEWAGVNAAVVNPGLLGSDIDNIIPLILQKGLSPIMASLFIAGIVAAGMSSIDSLLIITTGAVTRDLYQKVINKEATDDQVMKMSKVVTVIIGIVVIIFGVTRPGTIFQIILFAFGGMGAFVIPVLSGLYWKRSTSAGAISSVVVTVVLMIAITFFFKDLAFGFHPLIISSVVGALTMYIVSMMTQAPTDETIERHFNYMPKQSS